ncbi:MAG: hypothetical protein AAF320_01930, partial [Myxococcota bacterium]
QLTHQLANLQNAIGGNVDVLQLMDTFFRNQFAQDLNAMRQRYDFAPDRKWVRRGGARLPRKENDQEYSRRIIDGLGALIKDVMDPIFGAL